MRNKKTKNSANPLKSMLSSQRGFTLVELLIVIVIIGILAGVVIGVLNPVQQQNRARDGATRAQLDKMALSTKSLYVSSPRTTQRAPTEAEFAGGIASSADVAANCSVNTPGTTDTCLFQITGQPLANNCAASAYNGSGAVQCSYLYYRTPTQFMIAARGQANPVTLFVYTYAEDATSGSVVEGFWSCPSTFDVAGGTTPTVAGGCTLIN